MMAGALPVTIAWSRFLLNPPSAASFLDREQPKEQTLIAVPKESGHLSISGATLPSDEFSSPWAFLERPCAALRVFCCCREKKPYAGSLLSSRFCAPATDEGLPSSVASPCSGKPPCSVLFRSLTLLGQMRYIYSR